MKKLMMILLAAGMVSVASAQHVRVGGGFGGYRGGYAIRGYAPAIGFGFYPGLYWGYGYPYYGYPYGYPNGRVATKLQMQVSDIKADYADRIASVKSDNTLSGKEKRQQVRSGISILLQFLQVRYMYEHRVLLEHSLLRVHHLRERHLLERSKSCGG